MGYKYILFVYCSSQPKNYNCNSITSTHTKKKTKKDQIEKSYK